MKPIEEMTLKEIRELKKQLADRIEVAVIKELTDFEKEHRIPAEVYILTNRIAHYTEYGEELTYCYTASAQVTLQGEQL